MKRVIKFYNQFQSDKATFSSCSTVYEVLPILVEDNAGPEKLLEIVKSLKLKNKDKVKTVKSSKKCSNFEISHAVKIGTVEEEESWYRINKYEEFLGFIKLPSSEVLELHETLGHEITSDMLHEIINYQECDISDCVDLRGDNTLIIDSWNAFHYFELLGYRDFNDTLELLELKYTFYDEVFMCSECSTWDYIGDNYTYNYRIYDHEILGLNECNCANEYVLNNLDFHINNADATIEGYASKELEEQKKIKVLETFIGGMTDGRGGYIYGKFTREGTPKIVLEEYLNKYPNDSFVFIHEESGQFQTYFSIAKVLK